MNELENNLIKFLQEKNIGYDEIVLKQGAELKSTSYTIKEISFIENCGTNKHCIASVSLIVETFRPYLEYDSNLQEINIQIEIWIDNNNRITSYKL